MTPQQNPSDTLFRCPTCQKEESHLFRDVLRQGWPLCHGTMKIVDTQADLTTAFDQAIQPIVERAAQALRDLLNHKK